MIINTTPQNEAIISNVGEVGEFRIRNSAKAFGILSSGLYANKIRAVIRELSCNAVDSHVAAGKGNVPFDVHLPNQLEPWFSVRDYGLGLSHDDVTNIYTTYFESTKTNSNAFIGGLGLGSKSPFAYTDNFTVTATMNGIKGIFTAFINDVGVPSIAMMEMSETTDPNGVEVKFSVNNFSDFGKFKNEALAVFKHFTLRPVISGAGNFKFEDPQYTEKDIISGVHYFSGAQKSIAVMGNVPYPIDIPNADLNLGPLKTLLTCGLELNFSIGEIDFQASREGLSYNQQTIDAIKNKLAALTAILVSKLSAEADKHTNLWERLAFLEDKHNLDLWRAAVVTYVVDTKFPLMKITSHGFTYNSFEFEIGALARDYNIHISGFIMQRSAATAKRIKVNEKYDHSNPNNIFVVHSHIINPSRSTRFVITDSKKSALQRAKHHWRTNRNSIKGSEHVYVLSKADKNLEMNLGAFYNAIKMPPANSWILASTLLAEPRTVHTKSVGGPIGVFTLQSKNRRGWGEQVWRDGGTIDTSDTTTVRYYVELNGRTPINSAGKEYNVESLIQLMSSSKLPGLTNIKVYGIKKSDTKAVRAMKNWIALESYIGQKLDEVPESFWIGAANYDLDKYNFVRYNKTIVQNISDPNSLFTKVFNHYQGRPRVDYHVDSITALFMRYRPDVIIPLTKIKSALVKDCKEVERKYPLLKFIDYSNCAGNIESVAEYINFIDLKKESV